MPLKNREARKEYYKKYYLKNKARINKYGKERWQKIKRGGGKKLERLYECNKKWTMKPRVRVYRKKYRKKWNKVYRQTILNYYGNRCVCCGESHPEFLCIDHINNDGAKQRKKINLSAGSGSYSWIIRNDFPDDLQILCANCNMAKAYYGVCPHQKKKGGKK